MIDMRIKQLVGYGIRSGLIDENERIYSTNMILDVLHKDEYSDNGDVTYIPELEEILKEILLYAVENNIVEDNAASKDLFDTRLMNCITPRPSQVIERFQEKYTISPRAATEYYYMLSNKTDYIRSYRIKKDMKWKYNSKYGKLDITINLSKPEKDPKSIAAAKNAPQGSYPKCLLCMENEGYAGRMNHPSRLNHRIIPIKLDSALWGFQYSPYVYYNEHCIVFNGMHTPMKIERNTFVRLFDFVSLFPHYTLGSNADLPIVGGSILSHDHFQGGNYEFPMEKCVFEENYQIPGYEDIVVGRINWPVSVIRLQSRDTERLINLADHIYSSWKKYTDEDAFIYSNTNSIQHNTITPIARKRGDMYELDIALRNNITTQEHPMGVYHPHARLHHIKKENIGLIEVMGLAVLPSRLKADIDILSDALIKNIDIANDERVKQHAQWIDGVRERYRYFDSSNTRYILENEIGKIFEEVLEDAGVYKTDAKGIEAYNRFIKCL